MWAPNAVAPYLREIREYRMQAHHNAVSSLDEDALNFRQSLPPKTLHGCFVSF